MADKPAKKDATPEADDSLLTLKFAQAEADLAEKNGGLGPTTNVYVTDEENSEITQGEGPVDSQGQRRGDIDPDRVDSNAGSHS